MDKRPFSGRGPVQGSCLRSMEGSQWVLQLQECVLQKIGISAPPSTMNAEERRLKDLLIVTAMATLIYARPTPPERYVCPRTCTPPLATHMLYVLWQVSSWCGRRGRHAGADSTVKMITTAPEARHPAAGGAPPPSRRLHPGGAGRRRRRRLHLRAALRALPRVHGGLEWRAPRPPAAPCLGTWLVGYLKRVLRWSMHILAPVCVSLL